MVSLKNSTLVKFVMLWPSNKPDVRVPDQKKNIALPKNIAPKKWQFVANAVPKYLELRQYIQNALIFDVRLKDVHIVFG